MAEELNSFAAKLTQPPSVKCSYCKKTYEDEDKFGMGLETEDWAICFRCFRKLCDILYKEKGGAI